MHSESTETETGVGRVSDEALGRKREWLVLLAIAVITLAVYLPSLSFGFVYDDHAQIVETTQLNSVRMIPRYFTGHVWAWKTPGVQGPYYRPVFLLWLLMNQLLFGLDATWWHLMSVLTHVTATVLVYALAKRLTRDYWIAAVSALLFGLHPVHVESVDWVSGITDPLVTVLLVSSFLCYLNGSRNWRLLSLVAYIAALLEKEVAVVLPALIFAYEWLFANQSTERQAARVTRAAKASVPYVLVTLIYLGVRVAVLHELTMVMTPVPLRDMALTWPSMLAFYLRHLLWPVALSIFYSLPVVHTPDVWNFIIPCMILTLAGVGLALWSKRSRVAAFSTILLIVPLLPAMNLRAYARVEIVHDRYLYLPSIGICILAAMALRRVYAGSTRWVGQPARQWAVVIPLACALGYGVINQGQYWANSLSLFTRGVEIAPNNEIANQCMGTAMLSSSRFVDAIPYYQRALQANPRMSESLYSLGRAYYELGMYAESERYFERAIAVTPRYSYPYLYYGLAKLKEGQLEAAERVLRHVLRIKAPDDYREFHLALGQVLEAKGDYQGALREFEAEIRENPDPSKAFQGIAEAKAKLGNR